MTEEEIQFQIELRIDFFLQEMQTFSYYTMGKYFYGIKIPENVAANIKAAHEQFINDMRVYIPNFELEDIQMNGRFLMGYDGTATVNGNQVLEELKGNHEIYSLRIEGTLIENLPDTAYDKITGELYYPMAIGEKFRLTYKPK